LGFGGWFEEGNGGKVDGLTRVGFVFYYGGFVGCGAGFRAQANVIEEILSVLQIGFLFCLP
jgi:hypothetical protein